MSLTGFPKERVCIKRVVEGKELKKKLDCTFKQVTEEFMLYALGSRDS